MNNYKKSSDAVIVYPEIKTVAELFNAALNKNNDAKVSIDYSSYKK